MDLVLDSDRKQLKLLPGADSGRYIKGVLNYRNTSPSRSPPSITRNPPWSTPPPSCFQCVRCPSVLWVARLLWYQELLPITLCLSQAKTAVSIHFFGAILSLTRYVISLHDHASVSAPFHHLLAFISRLSLQSNAHTNIGDSEHPGGEKAYCCA